MNRETLLQVQQIERQRVALLKDRILCCTVAGCLAGGAGAVRSALEGEVAKQGRTGEIEVCGTGCMGLCSEGPLVRSSASDAIYTNVNPADAPAIVNGGRAPALSGPITRSSRGSAASFSPTPAIPIPSAFRITSLPADTNPCSAPSRK